MKYLYSVVLTKKEKDPLLMVFKQNSWKEGESWILESIRLVKYMKGYKIYTHIETEL